MIYTGGSSDETRIVYCSENPASDVFATHTKAWSLHFDVTNTHDMLFWITGIRNK